MKNTLTVEELKAERTWLIQHGFRERYTIGGMSFKAAHDSLERDVAELNREIAKLELEAVAESMRQAPTW